MATNIRFSSVLVSLALTYSLTGFADTLETTTDHRFIDQMAARMTESVITAHAKQCEDHPDLHSQPSTAIPALSNNYQGAFCSHDSHGNSHK
jgi:hypothetical protein